MTKYEEDLKNIETFSPAKLSDYYKRICDVYAHRLCDMYGWDFRDCWWVSDNPGGVFCSPDMEYSLSFDDVRYIVDKCVLYEDFVEWFGYNVLISYAQENEPNNTRYRMIGLEHWLCGCPIIPKEELVDQEQKYWNSFDQKVKDIHAANKDIYTQIKSEVDKYIDNMPMKKK